MDSTVNPKNVLIKSDHDQFILVPERFSNIISKALMFRDEIYDIQILSPSDAHKKVPQIFFSETVLVSINHIMDPIEIPAIVLLGPYEMESMYEYAFRTVFDHTNIPYTQY